MSKHSINPCSFPECLRPVRAWGLCHAHYLQQWEGRELTPLRVRRSPNSRPRIICDEVPCPKRELGTPCHVFRGQKSKGYGFVCVNNRRTRVHRYIWECEVGPIEPGMLIDHQCRVLACCNVDHLRVVTHQINSIENVEGSAWQLNAAKTHCPHGHPYDEANTHIDAHGHRYCRECRKRYRKSR